MHLVNISYLVPRYLMPRSDLTLFRRCLNLSEMTIFSKYANLPDIDVESPDTFENDVSSHPSQDPLPDVANVNVETSALNIKSATEAFKAKEKLGNNPFIWNNESKAQKLHFLSLQLFNLGEQLREITLGDDSQDSFLSKIRGLESDIQGAIAAATAAKSNSWNLLDGVCNIRDSLPKEPSQADGPLVLELYSKPGNITDSDQFIEFESRVANLEKMLGASLYQPHVDLQALDIIKTLKKLNSQISLLTDTEIQDQMIKKLEKFKKLELDSSPVQKSEKVEAMYDFLHSEYIPMIPQILSRLVTLKETHDHAIQMVRRFKELEETVEHDHQTVSDVRKEMKTFESIIKDNAKDMQDNISTIMDRFKKLEGRIETLSLSK